MSTDVSVHQYTCLVYFFLFGITCTVTFPLICYGTYTLVYPEIILPVYLHTSPLSNKKYLPVTTTACVPAHRCTRSGPYLYILILKFQLTTKIYSSTFLLRCMTLFISMLLIRLTTKTYLSSQLLVYLPTHVPVHDHTCSFSYFNSA